MSDQLGHHIDDLFKFFYEAINIYYYNTVLCSAQVFYAPLLCCA